jgi:hypothetical protein
MTSKGGGCNQKIFIKQFFILEMRLAPLFFVVSEREKDYSIHLPMSRETVFVSFTIKV